MLDLARRRSVVGRVGTLKALQKSNNVAKDVEFDTNRPDRCRVVPRGQDLKAACDFLETLGLAGLGPRTSLADPCGVAGVDRLFELKIDAHHLREESFRKPSGILFRASGVARKKDLGSAFGIQEVRPSTIQDRCIRICLVLAMDRGVWVDMGDAI